MSTVLTEEEKLSIFPVVYENKNGLKIFEGIVGVTRQLMRVLKATFPTDSEEEIPVRMDDHYFYRFVTESGENDPEANDITVPVIVISKPQIVVATNGVENDHHWIRVGDFEETGVPRYVRFPIVVTMDLQYTIYVMRSDILQSMEDQERWEYMWRRHHFFAVGRKEIDGEVIEPGLHYRTRVIEHLNSDSVAQGSDTHIMKGIVQIERVKIVDENAPVYITGGIVNEPQFNVSGKDTCK